MQKRADPLTSSVLPICSACHSHRVVSGVLPARKWSESAAGSPHDSPHRHDPREVEQTGQPDAGRPLHSPVPPAPHPGPAGRWPRQWRFLLWNRGKHPASALRKWCRGLPSRSSRECSASVLESEVFHASPRFNTRCVPWFHKRSASGEASSVLDPGGRRTMGLSKRCRAGQNVVRAIWLLQIHRSWRTRRLCATQRNRLTPVQRDAG